MTVNEVMTALESMGNASTKKTFLRHGATEPIFGVKVGDMKNIVKKVRKNHDLSMALYETGNSDAMYLAGLIADEKKISKAELDSWARNAGWYMISEYTVAWIAAESPYGWELGLKWIDDPSENVQSSGWSALSSYISIIPDEKLDLQALKKLLKRIEGDIKGAANRTRYTMNGFVIALGSYVKALTDDALETAAIIGEVSVNTGDTACKVPLASDYIRKVVEAGRVGKKRKMARC